MLSTHCILVAALRKSDRSLHGSGDNFGIDPWAHDLRQRCLRFPEQRRLVQFICAPDHYRWIHFCRSDYRPGSHVAKQCRRIFTRKSHRCCGHVLLKPRQKERHQPERPVWLLRAVQLSAHFCCAGNRKPSLATENES